MADFPAGLKAALIVYDNLRGRFGYVCTDVLLSYPNTRNPSLAKLLDGLSKISREGVTRIATKHSHVCRVYCRTHAGTLKSLSGLFYWNGPAEVRRRILMRAWRLGRLPKRGPQEKLEKPK